MLVNVPRLITVYYTEVPDPSVPAQRVRERRKGKRVKGGAQERERKAEEP